MSFKPYTAFIVDACRTPTGKKNGKLRKMHPADLGAAAVDALVKRNKVDPALVDDVVFGCVSQVGAQSGNLGRNVVLSSCLPITVPGTTVDRQCGSGQQAIHFAAQAVMSGTQDVVIAGGAENMSLVPIGSSVVDGFKNGHGQPKGAEMEKRWPGIVFSQFVGAEMMCEQFKLSRQELDEFALFSHQRAAHANKAGYLKRELIEMKGLDAEENETTHDRDEGFRATASLDQMTKLKPLDAKRPNAKITAATSSQISDGAAAVLICNEKGLKKLGVAPKARIVSMALAGTDPVLMLAGPIPATKEALKRAKLTIDDIDIYEVNEAFASVPLAWAKELKADLKKLNVNGGAMANGHPLGATGCKLMAALLHELERRKGRYGLLAICEGGGTANCTIIERVGPDGKPLVKSAL